MAEDELEVLQRLIAQRLRFGRVVLSDVCRTAQKIVVLHKTGGAGVRVLVCRESEVGRPFVNIMPVVDGRPIVEDSHSLRAVATDGSGLDPIIATIEAAYEAALKIAHLSQFSYPPPRGDTDEISTGSLGGSEETPIS